MIKTKLRLQVWHNMIHTLLLYKKGIKIIYLQSSGDASLSTSGSIELWELLVNIKIRILRINFKSEKDNLSNIICMEFVLLDY